MSTRKRTTKRRTRGKAKKKVVKKKLVTASPECCFWTYGGPVINNLRNLLEALEKDISDEQYKYHISRGENDFAIWIEEVLCDTECARALEKIKMRKTAITKVKSCLRDYR